MSRRIRFLWRLLSIRLGECVIWMQRRFMRVMKSAGSSIRWRKPLARINCTAFIKVRVASRKSTQSTG